MTQAGWMFVIVPLIRAKEDIINGDMRSVILCNQIMMVDVITAQPESVPVNKNCENHVSETDCLANVEIGGEEEIAQKGRRHCHPDLADESCEQRKGANLDDMIKGKVGDTDHVLRASPGVVIGVSILPEQLHVVH